MENNRYIENFFIDGEFYPDIEDFIYKCFEDEVEQINELDDSTIYDCRGSNIEPLFSLSSEWIIDRIDDDRFSENHTDDEVDTISKILDNNIDFDKINNLIPKLYYENYKDKFTITKQDLLDAFKYY